ncbi:mitochondrial processing peptide beta subunit, partial [Trypanosoma cruzi]
MLGDHTSTLPRRCPPALLPWTPDYPWKRTAVSAHSTSPQGTRAYGKRAPPESFSTSGAHTNAGNRTTSRFKLAFDNLVEWIGVLEGLQDPPDRIMNLGRSLLNTFRMQLTIASDPGIRLSKMRARLHTAVHQTNTYARAPSLSSIGEKPNALCDANVVIPMDTRHLHAMCAREGITHNTGVHQKTAEGMPHAAHECWRRQ